MRVTNCRACDGRDLHPFLDLGETALANSYLLPARLGEPEPKFPLRVVLCQGFEMQGSSPRTSRSLRLVVMRVLTRLKFRMRNTARSRLLVSGTAARVLIP